MQRGLGGFLAFTAGVLLGGDLYPLSDANVRTVTVKIIADEELRTGQRTWPGDWTFPLSRAVQNVSREFEKRFGIRLKIVGIGWWASLNSKQSLGPLISDLCPRARKGKAEILAAFTDQPMIDRTQIGCSSYEDGVILIRYGPEAMMRSTLKHELCHVFGALDIMERGSTMDVMGRVKGDGFDEFTAGLVLLHKGRSFETGTRLWTGIDLDLALARCVDRHAAHPTEIPVLDRMALLCFAKKDWAELRRVTILALALDPGIPDLHNMLGIAWANLDEDGLALNEFNTAVHLRPEFPEALLNLAGCARKAGDAALAEEYYRKALEIMPDCSDGHRLFGEFLESRGRSAEAVGHYRAAIAADPRLERELGPRIKKLS